MIAINCYPERKGLITGVVIGSFALAPFVFNFIGTAITNPNNSKPSVVEDVGGKTNKYFGKEIADRVKYMFLALGIIYSAIFAVGLFLIQDVDLSPATAAPSTLARNSQVKSSQILANIENEHPNRPAEENNDEKSRLENKEVIEKGPTEQRLKRKETVIVNPNMTLNFIQVTKTQQFWQMFISTLLSGTVGLFAASSFKTIGIMYGFDDSFLTTVGSIGSLMNGTLRPAWGQLFDKTSYKITYSVVLIVQIVICATFPSVNKYKEAFFIWICCLYQCLGSHFSILAPISIRIYGRTTGVLVYSFLMLSMGCASLTVYFLQTYVTLYLDYDTFFYILAAISCCSFVSNLFFTEIIVLKVKQLAKHKKIDLTNVFERLTTHERVTERKDEQEPGPYASFISRLELKFTEFDEASTDFPPLVLPKTSSKVKKVARTDRKNITCKTPSIKHKIKARIPHFSELTSFPLSSTYLFEANMHHIGPGTYRIHKDNIPGGIISKISRFSSTPIEKAEEFLHFKQKSEKKSDPHMALNNKMKKIKLESMNHASKFKLFEETVHKHTKEAIIHREKEEKLQKYREKMERFTWRMKKTEIMHVKTPWMILLAGLSISTIIKSSIRKRILFKKSSFHYFSLIVLISRFLGKIKRMLFQYRYRRLQLRLKSRAKFLRNWLNRRTTTYRSAIIDLLEQYTMMTSMSQYLSCFKVKVLAIQRWLKKISKVNKARLLALSIVYRKSEFYLSDRAQLMKKSRPSILILEKQLSSYLKFALKQHLKAATREFPPEPTDDLFDDTPNPEAKNLPKSLPLLLYSTFSSTFQAYRSSRRRATKRVSLKKTN